jgi:bifunctional non-homologous end joining protein LigD
VRWRENPGSVRPMLATLADPPLTGAGLIYEPKYDGIRALADIQPARASTTVRVWSRLGNEKTSQFPSIAHALRTLGQSAGRPLLLDGEIVALDRQGRPTGFQRLQGRIHLLDSKDVERIDLEQPVAYILFDILRDGDEDLRGLPLGERRSRLEQCVRGATSDTLRISEQAHGDGRALHARAEKEGWEGLIVKEARSPYHSGRRSPAWRKLKVVRQQEFVVGGWTEPRSTRQYFGALLLGVYDEKHNLRYVGHTGTGFDQKELGRVSKLLKPREISRSPFTDPIKSNEEAHWVRPELVVQVRFTEWTDDGKLRHPVYLGLRDDKYARTVIKEQSQGTREKGKGKSPSEAPEGSAAERRRRARASGGGAPRALRKADTTALITQLQALQDARKDGTVELPDGSRLGVTNLAKVFWPKLKLTKGDLLRYYAAVAPLILPAVENRPLVMKRFPNGIDGPAFYQQRRQKEQPPAGVRIERLPAEVEPIGEDAERFIGGSLTTLLYMTQIAAISQDPWFSRVPTLVDADYMAIDLDPGDGATFARVLDVARWVRDELELLKVPGVPKTSGSRGLHIYIPMPPHTSYESGQLFCQIIATVVAAKHPRAATVERTVRKRAKGTVYVDYLQNILGKTLATAYSARASDFAGVSTPLTWKEVDEGVDPRDFTIVTAPARFAEVGDLWARLRTAKPANLESVFRKYASP